MLTIIYDPNEGLTLPDAKIEAYVRDFYADHARNPQECSFCVASELFIQAARALVAEGVIPHDDVAFIFKGEILRPNEGGLLPHWPNGFCDTGDDFVGRLLDKSIERGRQRRAERAAAGHAAPKAAQNAR